MDFTFAQSVPASIRTIALPVLLDTLPPELEPALRDGAKAARFTGKAGQVFDGFVERGGAVHRLALVGVGAATEKERLPLLEKAGAALAAKYLTSGEKELALDLSNSGLSPEQAAAMLLGLRLRSWRYDKYRTCLLYTSPSPRD